MISATFILGLLVLLATPGPTNTLLALGGATGGLRVAPPLLLAEVSAYLASVTVLGLVVQPLLSDAAPVRMGMQVAAAAYLLHAAVRMWRQGAIRGDGRYVTARTIATTTLLNPKGLIIAFVLMPAGWSADLASARAHLLAMAAMIPLVGFCWLLGGALAAAASGSRVRALLPRGSAVVLGLFAIALAGKALAG